MKAREFITELKRKKKEPVVQQTDADRAYDRLQQEKELHYGKFPAGSLQLFMPRPVIHSATPYQKHLQNISNPYRYEKDSPEIRQQYKDWADKIPDAPHSGAMEESAPVIATRGNVPPGHNKPLAQLWTSTAKRLSDGTYTSDWVRYVSKNHQSWMNETGYLYRVSRDATVLELNSDYDAEDIYRVFNDLGRVSREGSEVGGIHRFGAPLNTHFPWGEIAKHFDAVHHFPYSRGRDFLYGWDVESTAIFNPDILTLVGEVRINQNGVDPSDYDNRVFT